MTTSAFGVDHGGVVSKGAADYLLGPVIRGKKGQKWAGYKQSVKSGAGGTAIGAAGGAAIGAITGAALHNPKAGAKVGALVGADTGAIAGDYHGYKKNTAAGRFKDNPDPKRGTPVSKGAADYLLGPVIRGKKGQRVAGYKQSVKSSAAGAGIGAAGGAAIGAITGAALHNPKAGAAIGGLAGFEGGAIAGDYHGYKKNTAAGRFVDNPDPKVSKAATGRRGDKRNTKYAGATYGGALAGGAVGRQVAARSAGTTVGDVRRLTTAAAPDRIMAAADRVVTSGKSPARDGWKMGRAMGKEAIATVKAVPGGARTLHGGKVGAATGAVAGGAAYARHRHNVNKSAFGVQH